MTYELYRYIFLGALVACGLMAVLSTVLFFTLQIPRVIGDLSGRTARKAIEDIRKQNEQTGDKTYKSSAVNLRRGKVTEKISPSGKIAKHADSPFGTGIITQQLSGQQQAGPADETTVLSTAAETTVLSSDVGETTVLDAAPAPVPVPAPMPAPASVPAAESIPVQSFVVEYEITFIHTTEVIA